MAEKYGVWCLVCEGWRRFWKMAFGTVWYCFGCGWPEGTTKQAAVDKSVIKP